MRIFDTSGLRPTDKLSANEASWIYNGLDCCVTLEVRDKLREQIETELPEVQQTYATAMEKLAPTNYMNIRGLLVNEPARQYAIREYSRDLMILQDRFNTLMTETVGYTINWRSPLQLRSLFYDTFRLRPVRKRNAKGEFAPTVNADALEKFCEYLYPQVYARYILAMRDLGKKISFLETEVDPDGRMRTSLNIAGTDTGRFSSKFSAFGSGSNLQNVEDRLRAVFKADPGKVFVNVDLEQADARNVGARLYQIFYDEFGPKEAGRYLDACESGDLHTQVTRMVWPNLGWTGNLKEDKEIAEQPFYREHSYRDMSKKLGHGCLSADHEVLTPEGWKPINTCPSVIMQWSPISSEFVSPSHWEAKPYYGEFQIFNGPAISVRMTHDHRVPFKRDQYSKILHEAPAMAGPGKAIPLGFGWSGGTETVPARFIAAHMTDGSQEENWCSFHFVKERKKARLIYLCDLYNLEYRVHGDKIRVKGRFPKKPGAFQFSWTKECLADFVDELRYWDGHQGKTSITISSTSLSTLSWYQTFGRILGIGGNIQNSPNISGFGSLVWRLQQNKRKWASGGSITHSRELSFGEMVYCPTVSSGWFYVRRNGKISVTGNTNYFGTPPTMARHAKVEVYIIEAFQRKYFEAFPLIGNYDKRLDQRDWHSWVQQQLREVGSLTNLFGRRRIFFDRYQDQNTLRAAIAYDPQSNTGEELDRGWLNLWRNMPEAELLLPVHDSILFQLPYEGLEKLLPRALDLLKVTIELKDGRKFSVPLEAAVGWNWAKSRLNKKTGLWENVYGLRKWTGKEDREPPAEGRSRFSAVMGRRLR